MNEKDPIDELIAALRPDALTEDAYRRRRSADLARAFESPRTPQHLRRFSMAQRRPLLVIAAAAAGLAAAAIVVPQLISQDASSSGPATAQQPGVRATSVDAGGKAATTGTAANTRTILLAAAKVAAEEPITSGTFWYSRVRTAQKVATAPEEYMAKLEPLLDEWKAKETELKDKPAELKAAKKEFDEKVLALKTAKLPYTAIRSETTEMWLSRKDASGRRVKNQDVKVEFATPEDEAKWKQAGSPRLSDDDRPHTKEGAPEGIMSIGNDSLTWSNISKLPTGKEELKAKLHDLYDQSDQSGRPAPLAIYMWQTGADLLAAPITPGTRAALYQVLADSTSGLKSQTGVADGMGRTGVALETTGPDDAGEADRITYRLIFDDKTARLLELDVIEAGSSTPLLRQTYEAMGYVGDLGAKPAQ